MKKFLLTVFAIIFLSPLLRAQLPAKVDLGLTVGSTLFFGDLGGANYIGRPLFFDLESSLTKPVVMLHYHYQKSKKVGLKFQAAYTAVAGDDKLIQPKEQFAPEWFRWYRNLNFQSKIWEVSGQFEYYLTKYQTGSMQYRVGPYIFAGVGVMHMNPKANYNGSLVALQPLHTEGQGFDGIDAKEYMLYQPVFPIGVGIRYNVSPDFVIGFEYGDRKTFTDYMDDVSTSYVAQSDFNNYFANDAISATMAYDLSVRSDEIDPEGIYSDVTAPGQQRGDPTDKDHFIYVGFSFNYVLNQRKVSKKDQMKCMKWGGEGGSNTGKKK